MITYFMAVAAVSSVCPKVSLLQDVCFVDIVSQFTWARLAALVGAETTTGMLRSDAVRAAHVCSGFRVMWFFGDMRKVQWEAEIRFGDIDSNLVCLEALGGGISNLVAWKIRRLLQADCRKHKIKRVLRGRDTMVNASYGTST